MTMKYVTPDDDGRAVAIHHDGSPACGSYRAGHDPHWIQVLRVAPDQGTPVAVRDVRLVDPVSVELDVDTRDGSGRETLSAPQPCRDPGRRHVAAARAGPARARRVAPPDRPAERHGVVLGDR